MLPSQISTFSITSELAGLDATHDARAALTNTEIMASKLERLLMITEALWTFIKKEHNKTDSDLIRMVAEIDARDGRIDGRVAAEPPIPCSACNRITTKHRPKCIFCGKPHIAPPFHR